LRFTTHEPVALEINAQGEYTPIKSFEGPNSVVEARHSMNQLWGSWLEAAGHSVTRNGSGEVTATLEISPAFALTASEFTERARDLKLEAADRMAIHPDG